MKADKEIVEKLLVKWANSKPVDIVESVREYGLQVAKATKLDTLQENYDDLERLYTACSNNGIWAVQNMIIDVMLGNRAKIKELEMK